MADEKKTTSTTKRCSNPDCAHLNPVAARHCGRCGERFPEGSEIVEAQGFILRDAQGRLRAKLGTNEFNNAALEFFNEEGKNPLSIALDDAGGSHLEFRDADGNCRIRLSTIAEEGGWSRLEFCDGAQVLLSMGLHIESHMPMVQFYDWRDFLPLIDLGLDLESIPPMEGRTQKVSAMPRLLFRGVRSGVTQVDFCVRGGEPELAFCKSIGGELWRVPPRPLARPIANKGSR